MESGAGLSTRRLVCNPRADRAIDLRPLYCARAEHAPGAHVSAGAEPAPGRCGRLSFTEAEYAPGRYDPPSAPNCACGSSADALTDALSAQDGASNPRLLHDVVPGGRLCLA